MVLERILLQTIKFDLQVEHPYMFLLRYVKQLKGWGGGTKKLSVIRAPSWHIIYRVWRNEQRNLCNLGEKNKVCKVLQMAWTFVNDR